MIWSSSYSSNWTNLQALQTISSVKGPSSRIFCQLLIPIWGVSFLQHLARSSRSKTQRGPSGYVISHPWSRTACKNCPAVGKCPTAEAHQSDLLTVHNPSCCCLWKALRAVALHRRKVPIWSAQTQPGMFPTFEKWRCLLLWDASVPNQLPSI